MRYERIGMHVLNHQLATAGQLGQKAFRRVVPAAKLSQGGQRDLRPEQRRRRFRDEPGVPAQRCPLELRRLRFRVQADELKRLCECEVSGLSAASSAWNTQRPSIARLNLALGCPCAVKALPVGPAGE